MQYTRLTSSCHCFDCQHSLLQCGSVFPSFGQEEDALRRCVHWFREICTINWNHPEFHCPPQRQNTDLRSAEKTVRHLRRTWVLRAEEKVLDEMELGPKKFNKRQRLCPLTSSYVIKSPRCVQGIHFF